MPPSRPILPTSQLFSSPTDRRMPPTTHPAAPDGPRWQRRPGARPDEILQAAYEVFADSGYARTRLDDIARRAGISKGTLYLYFDSKEALFREMTRAKIVSCVVAGEEVLRQHAEASAVIQLEAVLRLLWRQVRRPEMLRIARLVTSELGSFPELGRFYYEEVVLRTRRLVERVLRRGVERGEFREEALEFGPRLIVSLLVHQAQTQQFFAALDPEHPADDEVFAGVLDLILHGLERS